MRTHTTDILTAIRTLVHNISTGGETLPCYTAPPKDAAQRYLFLNTPDVEEADTKDDFMVSGRVVLTIVERKKNQVDWILGAEDDILAALKTVPNDKLTLASGDLVYFYVESINHSGWQLNAGEKLIASNITIRYMIDD